MALSRRTLLAGVVLLPRQAFADAAPAAVTIDNFSFTPAELTVPVGTTVTWTNHDDIPHTVTDARPEKQFFSGALDTDDSFSFRFATPGRYGYFCALHPHMQGAIIVT